VFSPQTPTTIDALWSRIARERKLGYGWHRSGFVSGIVSLSAPVRDSGGAIVAAINISDSETVLKDIDTVRDQVLSTAAEVSARLGWRG
jgi:DNA-binding IclR family transcriptional regulator